MDYTMPDLLLSAASKLTDFERRFLTLCEIGKNLKKSTRTVCEIDLLKVEINFRDNVESESISAPEVSVFTVSENENKKTEKETEQIIDKTEGNLL